MKLVPCTNELFAFVDDEDYERVVQFNWHCQWVPGATTWYARGRTGGRDLILMHRFILRIEEFSILEVDHLDDLGLNNQKDNLFPCDKSEHNMRSAIRSDNVSGYKGVHFEKQTQKWRAEIQINGTHLRLGRHKTPEEAAYAYNLAAQHYFPNYARLNEVAVLPHFKPIVEAWKRRLAQRSPA